MNIRKYVFVAMLLLAPLTADAQAQNIYITKDVTEAVVANEATQEIPEWLAPPDPYALALPLATPEIPEWLALVRPVSMFPPAATLVYITPSGTTTGACSNGAIPNYTVANAQLTSAYGSGSTQIGPGTTVLWCGGTFTVAQGGTLFTEPSAGSGTSGNPITFTFDTNTFSLHLHFQQAAAFKLTERGLSGTGQTI